MYKNRFTGQWPEGSIRSKEEMLELIAKARAGEKVLIYFVAQSGSLTAYELDEKAEYKPNPVLERTEDNHGLCVGPTHDEVSIVRTGFIPDKAEAGLWHWYDGRESFLMGSGGLNGDTYGTEHRYFSDYDAAKKYSIELANDPEYIEQVRQWHAQCAMFDDYDDYREEDYRDRNEEIED